MVLRCRVIRQKLWQQESRCKVGLLCIGLEQCAKLKEDLYVGKAYALANYNYGLGGGTQYYITKKDRQNMKKRSIIDVASP